VQAGDSNQVANCVNQAHTQHTVGQNGGSDQYYGFTPQGGSCFAQYLVTDTYFCDGSGTCTYLSSTWEFIGTVCY
jgi:hypothetical protein